MENQGKYQVDHAKTFGSPSEVIQALANGFDQKISSYSDMVNIYNNWYRSNPLVISNGLDSKSIYIKFIKSISNLGKVTIPEEYVDKFIDSEVDNLTLAEYANFTETTVQYNQDYSLVYLGLEMGSEVGEIQKIIKKINNTDKIIGAQYLPNEVVQKIMLEIGDLFWCLTRLCIDLNLKPENVLRANMAKLNKHL